MSTGNKQLYRSRENRMIGGVCAGLGEFFGIDPTIVRLFFVFGALLHSFEGAAEADVASLLKGLKIVHVYGRIAPLDWQGEQSTLPYGRDIKKIGCVNLCHLAGNIHVVYDER